MRVGKKQEKIERVGHSQPVAQPVKGLGSGSGLRVKVEEGQRKEVIDEVSQSASHPRSLSQ